ncbi:MAG: putative DNA binding domain-containing protein [Lachnospiraceae bacterium]|nr:putative DNA binding domain-containing protein [Lachnospiraceae bacterium]
MNNMIKLVNELCKNKDEMPWLEFKHNNYDPQMIGEDICALANAAALYEKPCAYMIWGVDNATHEIIGTDYDIRSLKKGNQELENWLRSLLSKNTDFKYETAVLPDGKNLGVLTVQKASNHPAVFQKIDYIRVGSYTKKLKDYPELQERLWRILQSSIFEEQYARQDMELNEALSLLGYTKYFDILGVPQPTSPEGIAHYLIEEACLIKQDNGLYAITNMGALLFAKRLSSFERLSRKSLRIVQYSGKSRVLTLKEESTDTGYVLGFEEWIRYIEALLPSKEVINSALRETLKTYPTIAIREAIANALIHQDFSVTGSGVTVEVFDNRIEITNPGKPLVDVMRIIDNPPRSRNEKLANLMRKLRMCEELGTGWDKIAYFCELQLLPAPKIDVYENGTRVTLFSGIPFSELSGEDRRWACYIHACVRYVQGDYLTNSSLRERFGVKESSSGTISRLIKDAVAMNYIKPLDPDTAPRYMKYVPAWA